MSRLSGDGMRRGALDAGDDEHLPDGYTALQCRIDPDMLTSQFQRHDTYFKNAKRVKNSTFDIHRKDFVFALDAGVDRTPTGSKGMGMFMSNMDSDDTGGGEGIVTSTLNGIEALFTVDKALEENHPLLEYFILSRIRVLGQAYTEMVYDRDGETSGRSFAVQYGGICTRVVRNQICVGEYVRYAIPTKEEFESPSWKMEEGNEPSKIGLVLKPVREFDGMSFGMRCYCMARILDLHPSKSAESTSSYLNTAVFGRALETFALSCGLNMVYRLMQFGILSLESPRLSTEYSLGLRQLISASKYNRTVSDASRTRNSIWSSIFGKNIASIHPQSVYDQPAGPAVADAPASMINVSKKTVSQSPNLPGVNTSRRRASTAFVTAMHNGGRVNVETWAEGVTQGRDINAAPNAGDMRDLLVNADFKVHDTPEEVVVILANLFGLTDTSKMNAPLQEAYRYHSILNTITDDQTEFVDDCKKAFLDSIFTHETTAGFKSSDTLPREVLEVGYNRSPDFRLSKTQLTGDNRRNMRWMNSENGYDRVNTIFENSLPFLFQCMNIAVNFQKSFIAGKAIRNGNPDQALDFVMVN